MMFCERLSPRKTPSKERKIAHCKKMLAEFRGQFQLMLDDPEVDDGLDLLPARLTE